VRCAHRGRTPKPRREAGVVAKDKILITMSWFRELAGDERPSQRIPSTGSCFLDGRLGDTYQSATSPSMSGMRVIIQFRLPSTFLDSGKHATRSFFLF